MLSSLVLLFSYYALTFLIYPVSLLQDNFYLYFRIQLKYHFLHEAFPHFPISSQSILCLFLAQQATKYNSLGFRIFMHMCVQPPPPSIIDHIVHLKKESPYI